MAEPKVKKETKPQEKQYQCKKCKKTFTELAEYRAHILKCKGDAEETEAPKAEAPKNEPEKVNASSSEEKRKKLIKEARSVNVCRGYYEGKFKEICDKYARCDACWADFGRQE